MNDEINPYNSSPAEGDTQRFYRQPKIDPQPEGETQRFYRQQDSYPQINPAAQQEYLRAFPAPQQKERGKSPALCIVSMALGVFSLVISAPMVAFLTSILYNIKHGVPVFKLLLSHSTDDVILGAIELSLEIIVIVMLFVGLAMAIVGLVFGVNSVKEKRRKYKMAVAGIITSSITLVAILAAAVCSIIYLLV